MTRTAGRVCSSVNEIGDTLGSHSLSSTRVASHTYVGLTGLSYGNTPTCSFNGVVNIITV